MATGPTTADYRAMIESAPEAIIVYTPEKLLFLNAFAAQHLGFDAAELVGRPIMDFVHPESIPIVVSRLRQREAGYKGASFLEIRFVSRDGRVTPTETISVPIRFGEQWAFLGLIRDMTKRNEIERALRESEERFANAFRHSAHGMAFVGLDGSWLRANRALCEMLGYSEQELLERKFADITHPDDVGTDLEQLRRMVDGEISSYHRIKRYQRKDGRVVWISLAVSAVHDETGAPIYFIGQLEDITLRRAMEDERANSERRAGIVETTIAVAHEMNNALTVLMLNAELLKSGVAQEELPEVASEILSAAGNISSTVQRLRQLVDPQSVDYLGESKMIDLSPRNDHKDQRGGGSDT
jgi:PAS domain S-box-containing protein